MSDFVQSYQHHYYHYDYDYYTQAYGIDIHRREEIVGGRLVRTMGQF